MIIIKIKVIPMANEKRNTTKDKVIQAKGFTLLLF
jgi:hypothetical protein